MKPQILALLKQTLKTLQDQKILPKELNIEPNLERTRDKAHGNFATNIALLLAKPAQCAPRVIAEKICEQFPLVPEIEKIDIAGQGFINFYLAPYAKQAIVKTILTESSQYGNSEIGKNSRLLLEFVSSNPTGPLHVGHGRGAAYGAALSNVLKKAGFHVDREYYINDGGRQMDILTVSVWLRYLERCGETFVFPSNAYQGEYVFDIADTVIKQFGNQFCFPAKEVFENVPPDEPQGGDKEIYIDALISRAKKLLGEKSYEIFHETALSAMLKDIKQDLEEFRVTFDHWFSERSLIAQGAVQHGIDVLKERRHTFEQEGALWFRSTAFGDDKDRVLIRENGQPTYFAVDIAYHLNKLERGHTQLINIFGADHHGYITRLRAAIEALGYDKETLQISIVQFATLYRGKEKIPMSTRSGSFVTLRELRVEVGNDATRFFYVLRKCEQHMDFDLELAKSHSNENPVYYVQYAHARICSVFEQLKEKKITTSSLLSSTLELLTQPEELDLLEHLAAYPDVLESAAKNYEPHLVAHYLRDLAGSFHAYYNAHSFLVDDEHLRSTRLALIEATRIVLANGLELLGVSAPTKM